MKVFKLIIRPLLKGPDSGGTAGLDLCYERLTKVYITMDRESSYDGS